MATSNDSYNDAIVRKAMMEDLGKTRLEDLPMEDRGSKSLPRQMGNHRPSSLQPVPSTVAGTMWKAAIESGLFEDEDAEAVKGLSDLGGGRLHASRAQQVQNQTSSILSGLQNYGHKARYYHDKGMELPPTSTLHFKKGGKPASRMLPKDDMPIALSAKHGASQMQQRLKAQTPGGPPPFLAPPKPAFQGRVAFRLDGQLSLSGAVYVTGSPSPSLFLAAQGLELCNLSLDHWHSHAVTDLEVLIHFKSPQAETQCRLLFNQKHILLDFTATVSRLRKAPVQPQQEMPVCTSAGVEPLSNTIPAFGRAISTETKQLLVELDSPPNGSPSSGLMDASIDHPSELSQFPTLRTEVPPAPTPLATSTGECCGVTEGPSVVEKGGRLEEMVMHLDEVIRILISLFCLAGKTGKDGDELMETAENIRTSIVDTYRSLSEKGAFFPHVSELERQKVFQNFLAKPMELSSREVTGTPPSAAILPSTDLPSTVDTPDELQESAIPTEAQSSPLRERLEYTQEELLTLKPNAAPPPARLETINFLPRPPKNLFQQEPWEFVRSHPAQTDAESPQALDMSALDGVVGLAMAPKGDETQANSAVGSKTVNTAVWKRAPHKGLGSSRWADHAVNIIQKATFTGPGFEKRTPEQYTS